MKDKSNLGLSAWACIVASALLYAQAGLAQVSTIYAYPNAGQSADQQARDRFECHQWAVSQTGFDPTMAAPVASSSYPSRPAYDDRYPSRQRQSGGLFGIGDGGFFGGSGALGDAATGAAIGAAGGAIAGNAGKGAAWGAIGGTLLGALTRAGQPRDPDRPASRPVATPVPENEVYAERRDQADAYVRAYGACMTARDYTVQ